jgi:hypothetical protein
MAADGLRRILDGQQPFAIRHFPRLDLYLRQGLTLSEDVKGLDGTTYHNPSYPQYGTIMGLSESVICLLNIAKSLDIAFESIFSPRESNTKIDLLSLALALPPHAPDVARLLLAFMRDDANRAYVGDVTKWTSLDAPGRGTPLSGAVADRQWDRVVMLVEAGADLFKESRGGVCPLIALLLSDVQRFEEIANMRRGEVEVAVRTWKWSPRLLRDEQNGRPIWEVLRRRDHPNQGDIQIALLRIDPGMLRGDRRGTDIRP